MSADDEQLFGALEQLTPELKIKLMQLLSQDDSIASSIANTNRSDDKSQKQIASLRRYNTKLQEDLYKTLQDYKDAQQSHQKEVCQLEKDLEQLKAELNATAQSALESDLGRKKLLKEKIEAVKEKNDAKMDQEIISDLESRIENLELEQENLIKIRKEKDEELIKMKHELDIKDSELFIMKENVQKNEYWKEEFEKLSKFVDHLKEELEFERSRNEGIGYEDALGEENAKAVTSTKKTTKSKGFNSFADEALKGQPNENWEWTNWFDRSLSKLWERDIDGLRSEINDLSVNKDMAFTRIRENVSGMMGSTLDMVVPTSVKNVADTLSNTATAIAKGDTNSFLNKSTLKIVQDTNKDHEINTSELNKLEM
ncbi:hypothetical protein HDU92_002697 [Lobulomyces angularis]|nr:hypothetical protein HDU92_002697 [Lobulomyces angularis]